MNYVRQKTENVSVKIHKDDERVRKPKIYEEKMVIELEYYYSEKESVIIACFIFYSLQTNFCV